MGDSKNPLISTSRASSDTSPAVQLHPLVLLTISDYLTRHTLRGQKWPIIGAILGIQNGKEVTMEVAYECKVLEQDGQWIIDDDWFKQRLEQYKDVYKAAALDIVGWFSIGELTGPQTHHLLIQEYFQEHNESSVLLLFQPEATTDMASGKLPLSLYESVREGAAAVGDASSMDVDGTQAARSLKFRELGYTVETGEAEMISVDFVARGGGNATRVDTARKDVVKGAAVEASSSSSGKGKGKAKQQEDTSTATTTPDAVVLLPEDEELLSALTAKTNAIRMLHKRLTLLQKYLAENIPAGYLTDASLPFEPLTPSSSSKPSTPTPSPHIILRSIAALLTRLPTLSPPDTSTFVHESASLKSDVALVGLLSSILTSAQAAKELGRKYAVVEGVRQQAKARQGGGQFLDSVMMDVGEFGGAGGAGRRKAFGVGDGGFA